MLHVNPGERRESLMALNQGSSFQPLGTPADEALGIYYYAKSSQVSVGLHESQRLYFDQARKSLM